LVVNMGFLLHSNHAPIFNATDALGVVRLHGQQNACRLLQAQQWVAETDGLCGEPRVPTCHFPSGKMQ